jgi:hypothetical protein
MEKEEPGLAAAVEFERWEKATAARECRPIQRFDSDRRRGGARGSRHSFARQTVRRVSDLVYNFPETAAAAESIEREKILPR